MKKKIQKIYKEGQSALEYVFSYGWSLTLLIIIIAAGILMFPDLFGGESCSSGSSGSFIAVSGLKSSDTGLEVVLTNQTGLKVQNASVATNGSFIAGKDIGTLMPAQKTKIVLETSVPKNYDIEMVIRYTDNYNFQRTVTLDCRGQRSSLTGGEGNSGSENSVDETFCGDGTCNGSETCSDCALDCGACAVCGDSICQATESSESCPQDCISHPPAMPSAP